MWHDPLFKPRLLFSWTDAPPNPCPAILFAQIRRQFSIDAACDVITEIISIVPRQVSAAEPADLKDETLERLSTISEAVTWDILKLQNTLGSPALIK
jgi:hypothetical protein